MNAEPKIKSRCQELLREQEMGRREIRKLISKTTDVTQCLKAYDWTLRYDTYYVWWTKTFTLPYPLLVEWNERFYLQQKIVIQLGFTSFYYTCFRIKTYLESVIEYYLNVSNVGRQLNSKLIMSLIFQNFAAELPKVITLIKTEPFYDEKKQEQVKVIPVSRLTVKIRQVFDEICKKFDPES